MAEETPAGGRLIAFRNDRLGARLLTLVNAMRMSADYGLDFAVYWPQAVDVTAVFNDATELFQPDFVAERFIDRPSWIAVKSGILRIGDVQRQGSGYLVEQAGQGNDISVDQAFGINVLKGEDQDTVKAAFIDMVDKVPFSDALQGPIAELRRALDGVTAYHIRRGDLTDGLSAKNKPWPHKVVPHEFYEMHMERTLDKGAILFSDDAWTLDHYTKTFPALTTIRDLIDLDGLTEAQRDFIELYAMSRAAKIIAPERSAFSSTAVDLGRAVKCSVTDDMTDEMSVAAHERLVTRLRERPESFPGGDGEIGQSLAHIGPWLEEQGRWQEVASLFADRVADGLNIAFVYPDAMRYQHRAGDVDGVLKTASHMQNGYVYHVRYYVDAEIQHGYGLIRAGRMADGLRRITNGFWHGPTAGASRILVPALIDTGLLSAKNFIPVSPVQVGLHRRKGPLKHLITEYGEILKLPDVGVPTSLGTIDSAVWDWAPLLRSVSLQAALRQDAFGKAREQLGQLNLLEKFWTERDSLLAVFDAYEGKTEQAIDKLTALTRLNTQHAMTWQRLSHVFYIAREFQDAMDAAEQAAARGGGTPALHAWAGMVGLRCRAVAQSASHLRIADAADIGMPSIPSLYSQALQKSGNVPEALAAIDRAIELGPMEVDFAMQRARLLEELDRLDEAVATLDVMIERYRAPAKLFTQMVNIMLRMGNRSGAMQMVETAQQRYPEHPAVLRLVADTAA